MPESLIFLSFDFILAKRELFLVVIITTPAAVLNNCRIVFTSSILQLVPGNVSYSSICLLASPTIYLLRQVERPNKHEP
jgi:hypothetical protein